MEDSGKKIYRSVEQTVVCIYSILNYLNGLFLFMQYPKIAVIIINWNGKHLLEECLDSVESQDYENYKVVFVDNGSADDSVKFVKESFPNIIIIELKANTGFAKANNVGIKKAFEDKEVKYIALLNNDAVVDRSWLSEMVRVVRLESQAGSIAPVIKKFYIRDEFDSVGIQMKIEGGGNNLHANEKDTGQCAEVKEVFGCTGCACLYLRDMLNDVVYENDYFDSDFFAYCEDVDLSWRARLRGWKCFTAPNAIVYHKGSETFQVYSYVKAYHSHRNRLFVMLKDYPFLYLLKGMAVFLISYLLYFKSIIKNKGYSARTKEKIGCLNMAKLVTMGWISFFSFLAIMLKKRSVIQKNKKTLWKLFFLLETLFFYYTRHYEHQPILQFSLQ